MAQTSIGALIGWGIGAYGKKPAEVTPEKIDPLDSANQALDIANATLPKAEALGSAVNAYNQSELDKLIEKALPGGAEQIKRNISAELRGELPPDVLEMIQRSVASRAVAGGFSGTGFGTALGAKDLGLASLQATEHGLNAAQRWLSQVMVAPMDVSRSFFTPQQMLGFNIGERDMRYQAERVNAGIRAAPDPAMVQLAQGIDNDIKMIEQAAVSYFTGGLGGMGGGKAQDQEASGGYGGPGRSDTDSSAGWNFLGMFGHDSQAGKWFLGKNPGKG